MDRRTILALAVAALVAAAFACPAPAQDGPEHPAQDPEMMAKMMAMAQPGPEHEELAKMVGDWEVETHMFMAPGADPMVMTGSGHAEMVLGGRFLQASTSGGEGTPFPMESISYMGYDRRKGEYTLLGLDTMGTYWVTAAGNWDEECGCISMYGEDEDPVVGATKKYWFNYYPVSEGEFRMEIVFDGESLGFDGKHKMVEIIHRRAGE